MSKSKNNNSILNFFKDYKIIFLYLFLIFPFFKPPYFEYVYFIDRIYHVWFIVSSCFIYYLCLKKRCISKLSILTLILSGILLLSSIVNNVFSISTIKITVEMFTITLLATYGIKYNLKDFLEAIIILLGIFIIINFITFFIFPNGLYEDPSTHNLSSNFLLGLDNVHIKFFICYWLAYYTKYYLTKKHSKLGLIVIILSIISILICKSATTLVGAFIIGIYFVLAKFIDKIKFVNVISYSISFVVAYIGIIFFQIQKYFSFIIENILKKDVTLTRRTEVWKRFFQLIKNKPIWGYGILSTDDSIKIIKVAHAHNQILQVYFQGGIFAVIIFLIILFITLKELHKHFNNKLAKVYSVILFSLLIMGLAEVIALRHLLFILTFCYSIKDIINNELNNKADIK